MPRSDTCVVDACQGSEFDASSIVSAGRHDGKVGFLKDRRRVNVAYTQTKTELIIVIHESLIDKRNASPGN
eukprot:12423768-Karenia_brevis.AAC.1